MGDKTSIEWTNPPGYSGATLNPWTGCTKVSAGCAKCYISRTPPFRVAHRDFVKGHIPLVFHMERLDKMARRRKPTCYFVNSLSDLFHEDASDERIAEVFDYMRDAKQHLFQILTKRPERMRDFVRAYYDYDPSDPPGTRLAPWPNVWLGVTIENRHFNYRADLLRATPAAVRFISAEPLLGPLTAILANGCGGWLWPDPNTGLVDKETTEPPLDLTGIDQVIVGGESGDGARRFDLQWARDLRDACTDTGTAYFFKQLDGRHSGSRMDELPEDLRIREYPEVRQAVPEGAMF